jgi:hypothetical protein
MFTSVFGQSPHGDTFKIDCNKCHNPSGWTIDDNLIRFDHNKTEFQLEGAHMQTDCKSCHNTLVFTEATNQCISCHGDMHSSSVGNDCIRCHNTNTWLVDNIPEIHEENGFPLVGSHGSLSCVDCHFSETNLRFDNIGNECISCHQEDYATAESPNHDNFSTNCIECHDPIGVGWFTDNVGDHDFFPLTLGHDIADCTACHTTTNYSDADPNCASCHQPDYDATTNPNHTEVGFSNDCASCHTTNPGWTPANIDHDFFPLTLGHDIADCTACHTTTNYSDADPNCVSCHQLDFDATTNPNHTEVGFSNDCASCHTTNPGWTPASIDHDFFPLTLGHDIADCAACHTTTNYSDADPNCVSCHQLDFDNTNDPNHAAAQFPTDCIVCHTTNPGWTPADWDHDDQYFPIYSGKHDGEWIECTDCHTNPTNYMTFNCLDCHEHNDQSQVDNDHDHPGEPEYDGYVYESNACVTCHPNP